MADVWTSIFVYCMFSIFAILVIMGIVGRILGWSDPSAPFPKREKDEFTNISDSSRYRESYGSIRKLRSLKINPRDQYLHSRELEFSMKKWMYHANVHVATLSPRIKKNRSRRKIHPYSKPKPVVRTTTSTVRLNPWKFTMTKTVTTTVTPQEVIDRKRDISISESEASQSIDMFGDTNRVQQEMTYDTNQSSFSPDDYDEKVDNDVQGLQEDLNEVQENLSNRLNHMETLLEQIATKLDDESPRKTQNLETMGVCSDKNREIHISNEFEPPLFSPPPMVVQNLSQSSLSSLSPNNMKILEDMRKAKAISLDDEGKFRNHSGQKSDDADGGELSSSNTSSNQVKKWKSSPNCAESSSPIPPVGGETVSTSIDSVTQRTPTVFHDSNLRVNTPIAKKPSPSSSPLRPISPVLLLSPDAELTRKATLPPLEQFVREPKTD